MDSPQYRLFILGSGFSKPAGLPLGAELLDMVRQNVRDYFREHGWDGSLEDEINEWSELYPDGELTLESVLAYSHRKHFLRLKGSDEYFSHGSRSIVAARTAVQSILTDLAPRKIPKLYRDFASILTANDTVLTFNYDTILEDALDQIGKAYSLTPEWWLTNNHSNDGDSICSESYVDVLKLHGSIDWYDNYYHAESRRYHAEHGNNVPDKDPLFGPRRSIPIESLARGAVDSGYGHDLINRVFRVKNHRAHFPFAKSYEVVPLLLPPAHDKLLGHDPIRELWANMHRAFNECSAIVIIGYSMPSYDGYAYEALGRLITSYQKSGEKTYYGQRNRVPLQIVTLAPSTHGVLNDIPFVQRDKTHIWIDGFNDASLAWLDLGD